MKKMTMVVNRKKYMGNDNHEMGLFSIRVSLKKKGNSCVSYIIKSMNMQCRVYDNKENYYNDNGG